MKGLGLGFERHPVTPGSGGEASDGPATTADTHAGEPDEQLVLDDLRKALEVLALPLAEFLTPEA